MFTPMTLPQVNEMYVKKKKKKTIDGFLKNYTVIDWMNGSITSGINGGSLIKIIHHALTHSQHTHTYISNAKVNIFHEIIKQRNVMKMNWMFLFSLFLFKILDFFPPILRVSYLIFVYLNLDFVRIPKVNYECWGHQDVKN